MALAFAIIFLRIEGWAEFCFSPLRLPGIGRRLRQHWKVLRASRPWTDYHPLRCGHSMKCGGIFYEIRLIIVQTLQQCRLFFREPRFGLEVIRIWRHASCRTSPESLRVCTIPSGRNPSRIWQIFLTSIFFYSNLFISPLLCQHTSTTASSWHRGKSRKCSAVEKYGG